MSTAAPMDMSMRALPPDLAKELDGMLSELDAKVDAKILQISNSDQVGLNGYSILLGIKPERKADFVMRAKEDLLLDRVMGSMCGMAIGDALGHPFEFEAAQDLRETYDKKRHTFFDAERWEFHNEANVFGLQRGQWTDDAAMGLCMADSLIMRQAFHGRDMRVRFWNWWCRGYNNAFRKDNTRTEHSSVGLGGNISKSLNELTGLRSIDEVPPRFDNRTEDAGNGSLMRFTPVAIFLHASTDDMTLVHDMARESSYTTHPGIIAAEACSLLAHLIVRALQLPADWNRDVKAFLDQTTQEYIDVAGLQGKSGWGYDQIKEVALGKPSKATERCWEWRNPSLDIKATLKARGKKYNGYPVSAEYFGSYSLDGLAMALWSLYHTRSFDEAVVRSVNLLGDADSHGSITGQLAGALYGYRSIDQRFLTWLTRWDDHDFAVKGAMLAHLGTKFAALRLSESKLVSI